ncbi:family 43 glycosylhydrolase [Isoptericola haloaureus]|uniref:Family 43 glycosylhydrolase n=1 Tax=Isoptericola haloaureus TaxID=1542902 RepID=A0ABU7Z4R2_9MICO
MALNVENITPGGQDSASPSSGATYRNPVLAEDWPDPDVVRVGEDYYLVASSRHRSPGLPVLHSRDLLSWHLLTHALPRVAPDSYGELPRHGAGVWAPSIRHHDGQFHIVYADPDRGIFVTSATDPAGPWSPPRLLLGGLGLIDPCPLWAADGRTWLVHGWARSRAGVTNRLTMIEVDAALTRPLGPGSVVVDAEEIDGRGDLAGPTLDERDGWYWIFALAGGADGGVQTVLRARDPLGPYEYRVVLAHRDTPDHGPHRGSWVDTPDGDDFFVHAGDADAFGQVLHVQPMTWRDGWPVLGDPVPGQTWGQPVAEHPTPHGTAAGARSLLAADDFRGPLDPRWRWQADAGQWAEASGGRLRMLGPPADAGNLRTLPSVLGQPLPALGVHLSTTVRLDGPTASRAGLGVLGLDYGWIGLVRTEGGCDLVVATRGEGDRDERRVVLDRLPSQSEVAVGLDVDTAARVRFRIRRDAGWEQVGPETTATRGRGVGAELVVFAGAPLGAVPATGRFGALEARLDQGVPMLATGRTPGTPLRLRAGAEPVATLDDGRSMRTVDAPRPFLHPVRTTTGVPVTEVAPTDHLHHHGVSMAPADVDGVTFWGGRTYVRDQGSTMLANQGRQTVLDQVADDDRWSGTIAWTDPAGREMAREQRLVVAEPLPGRDDAWRLRWRSTLTPTERVSIGSPATNGRPGAFYGGWFWRTPFGDPRVLVADGEGMDAAHGGTSPWLALCDDVASLVAVQRGPVLPWFVRTGKYTGFGPALAVDRRLEITPERPLEVAVDVLVLDGPADRERVLALVEATGD